MVLNMPERFVYLQFQIDTNRINAHQKLLSMNRLEQWAKNEVIEILIPESVKKEISHERHPQRTKKIVGKIISATLPNTSEEQKKLQLISQILFPNEIPTQNQQNDIETVFNTEKYGAILITNDGNSKRQPGGILGKRRELLNKIGLEVLTDEEAVVRVQEEIRRRDDFARCVTQKTGQPLPLWVGLD